MPEPSEAWIKRALDAGAAGLIVPRIESREEAEAVIARAHYAPFGGRGEAPAIVRASGWGRNAAAYRDSARRLPLMLQIESAAGLAHAAEIADVPGVTDLFFGPADYAASAGIGPLDPGVSRAAAEVAARARVAGIGAATVAFGSADVAGLSAMGYTAVAVASDVVLMVSALDSALAEARHG